MFGVKYWGGRLFGHTNVLFLQSGSIPCFANHFLPRIIGCRPSGISTNGIFKNCLWSIVIWAIKAFEAEADSRSWKSLMPHFSVNNSLFAPVLLLNRFDQALSTKT